MVRILGKAPMKLEPLWHRILSALNLGWFTCRQLAKMLSVSEISISKSIHRLLDDGLVHAYGKKKVRYGRPLKVWGLAP